MKFIDSRISVILPTFNEAGNIVPVIEGCLASLKDEDCEIIVVDDNSNDGTATEVESVATRDPRVRLIVRKNERGLVSAIRRGINESTGEYCFWMDADGSMDTFALPSMMVYLRDNTDLVWGSRYIPGGAIKGAEGRKVGLLSLIQVWRNLRGSPDSFISTICSRVGNWITRFILTQKITDYSSGYFGGRKRVFQDVGVNGAFVDYCANLTYGALMKGYRIKEIPMVLVARKHGQSKTSSTVKDILRMSWQCFSNAIRLRLSTPDQRVHAEVDRATT